MSDINKNMDNEQTVYAEENEFGAGAPNPVGFQPRGMPPGYAPGGIKSPSGGYAGAPRMISDMYGVQPGRPPQTPLNMYGFQPERQPQALPDMYCVPTGYNDPRMRQPVSSEYGGGKKMAVR